MRHITTIAAMTLAIGCGDNKFEYAGFQTHKYFPIDGETRHWEYYSEDTSYLIRVDMLSPKTSSGSTDIATLEYTQVSPRKLLWTMQWSSDSADGVQVHGYMLEEGATTGSGDDTGDAGGDTGGSSINAEIGTWVSFDPPVQISKYQMAPGESVETTTGGVTYTSTLEEQKKCPNNWVAEDPWDCLVFKVEGDNGAPFVGTWEMATKWGVSRFQPASKSGTPWVLTDAGIEWED